MNITAWTGYAGMRAEVAAIRPETSALTWYGTGVASIEAVGAGLAALVALVADISSTRVLVVVAGVYLLGLLPTVVVAGGSPVQRAVRAHVHGRRRTPSWRTQGSWPVAGGVLLMFAASGPTLLSVGLAAELHGPGAVALVAAAFTLGALAAPAISWHVRRRRANGPLVWVLCAVGMIVGWVAAPWSVALMMLAQAASGLCMTALEGLLDTSIATRSADEVTGALARATAGRALGSAAAVALLPAAVAGVGLTSVMLAVTGLLGVAALLLFRVAPRGADDADRRDLPLASASI